MNPYNGARARFYEARRRGKDKWRLEDEFVASQLDGVTSVLDCPVGTGRFMPLYEARGIRVMGVDISRDMLWQATKRQYGELRLGSIFNLGGLGRFDLAVCVRLLNLLDSLEQAEQALRQLSSVAPAIVLTVRLRDDHPVKRVRTIVHDESAWQDMLDRLGLKVHVDEVVDPNIFGNYHLMRLSCG